jgi:hypothetical protein
MLMTWDEFAATLDMSSQLRYILGVLHINLKESLSFVLVIHDRHFLALLNLHDSLGRSNLLANVIFEGNKFKLRKFAFITNLCVKVSSEIMNVCCNRVAFFSHTKEPDHSFFLTCGS